MAGKVRFMLAIAMAAPVASAIDENGDGLCDVWQARYHAMHLPPGGDADGDGQPNRDEAVAGTDPFDARSVLTARIGRTGEGVSLTIPTLPGKRYQLLQAPSPDGPWTSAGDPQTATGAELVLTAPSAAGRRFFRASVADVDSDADGVADWAERQLAGFDPTNADSFGMAGGDSAAVREWLALLAGGQLAAEVAQAVAYESEASPAILTYTRGGDHARPFTVFLKPQGPPHPARSAAGPADWRFTGADGQPLADRLVIPAGQPAAELRIHATPDDRIEVPEHLTIRVGGTGLSSSVTLADATPTAANQRLFVAYLRPLPGVASLGGGIATLRLPGDNDVATVTVSFSNLISPVSSTQVQTQTAAILQSVPPVNYGGQAWPLRASQYYATDQSVLDALLDGAIGLTVFTEVHVAGEIAGTFQLTAGSTEFQPPPAPAPLAALDGAALDRDIVRFLTQASFGPTEAEIDSLRALVTTHGGDRVAAFSAWIDAQMAAPSPSLEAYTRAANDQEVALYLDPESPYYNVNFSPRQNNRRRGWWLLARHAPDQLRQRMASALLEIFVTSDDETTIRNKAYGAASYYDLLRLGAFGGYRPLLEGVSLHPVMGQYLSHLKNQKATVGNDGLPLTSPDENYAREVMQLFSIGLVRLHPDGSLRLGPDGLPMPTYSQNDIAELARVFTGLSFSKRHQTTRSEVVVDNTSFFQSAGTDRYEASWTHPMKFFPAYHDGGAKQWLGLAIPAGQTGEQDLAMVLDHLATHPNTAPFICRRLIQRLVTANPSAGYLHRVSQAFTTSSGNLGATVRAILLDPEARDPNLADRSAGSGKVREPLMRYLAFLRAFDAKSGLLLSDLSAFGYPPAELALFPSPATRMRLGDTDSTLGQTPHSAPSVFNWFLPDYAPSGPLSANGLVSPELQIANENTTFTANNAIYSLIYSSTGQGGNALPDQEVNGYTSSSDNIILSFAACDALYLKVLDTNLDQAFTALDAATFNNPAALRAACAAVLDHADLLLCGGALQQRYGDTPGLPRAIILDAAVSIRSANNASNSASTQASVMRDRIRAILWLVASSPEFVTQK